MGYRGELMIVHRDMIDPSLGKSEYGVGDRVAQILVRRRERIIWNEVQTKEELGQTERGDGGFGSTNKTNN
jgi:dUTPase